MGARRYFSHTMPPVWFERLARAILPEFILRRIHAVRPGMRRLRQPGGIDFGALRRLEPFSRIYGLERGQPIDRHYILRFLADHAEDVNGHVLEVAEDTYTRRFGGRRVAQGDVLDVDGKNPRATVIADLTDAEHVPSDTYDCIICTETLHLIYDIQAAIRTLHRILKPGGVLLATFPGISQISRYDMDRWGDHWRLTTASSRRLFEEVFPPSGVNVTAYGNVLSAAAFLYGIVTQELRQEELDHRDPDYELEIAVRAVKPSPRVEDTV